MKPAISMIPFRAFPGVELLEVQRLWTSLQTVLNRDEPYRWKRFEKAHNGVRRQNLIEHSYSIAMLGSYVLQRLKPYIINLDHGLVITALLVHDIAEAILKRDVSFIHKKASDDVDEYVAFMRAIQDLPAETRTFYQEAFLLQFCLDKDKYAQFDEEAQEIMTLLSAAAYWEAKVFNLIEHVDYLMFMLETHEAGNDYLLYHTLTSTEMSAWDHYDEEIPGFKEVILPPELREWFNDFIINYEENGGETRLPHEIS